jgi:hypothetical protein
MIIWILDTLCVRDACTLLVKLFHPRQQRQKCLLTLLMSSTRKGYKIHLYRQHQKCKGISYMMLSVYQMLLSDKLKGEF